MLCNGMATIIGDLGLLLGVDSELSRLLLSMSRLKESMVRVDFDVFGSWGGVLFMIASWVDDLW